MMPRKKSAQNHVVRHKDGSIWAKGKMIGNKPTGYWEWFRKDGTQLRSGHFDKNGEQTGEWITYDAQGEIYKVTQMKGKQSKPNAGKPKQSGKQK